MIVNELQYYELRDFLRPILRLEPYDAISSAWESILKMPVGTTTGESQYDKPLLKYKEYELAITYFRWSDAKETAIYLNFRTKVKWWHSIFKDQNAELVADLKRICVAEVSQLTFDQYVHKGRGVYGEILEGPPFLHDAKAFNRGWQGEYDISPLWIKHMAHDGRCFVHFFFRGDAYFHLDELTELRADWLDYMRSDQSRPKPRRLT